MFEVSEKAQEVINDYFRESGVDASVRVFLSQGG